MASLHGPVSLHLWDHLDDAQRRETLIHVMRQRDEFRVRVIRMAPTGVFNLDSLAPQPYPPPLAAWLVRFHAHDAGTPRQAAWAQVLAQAIYHHLKALPHKLSSDSDIPVAEAYLTVGDGPAVVAHLATLMPGIPHAYRDRCWALLDHWRSQWESVIAPTVWQDPAIWPYQKQMPLLNTSHSLTLAD